MKTKDRPLLLRRKTLLCSTAMAFSLSLITVPSPAVADSQTNTGRIDDSTAVNCNGEKCGLYSTTSPTILTNTANGVIDITAISTSAYGLYANLTDINSVATLSNSGSITITSERNLAGGYGLGLNAELIGNNSIATLSNSGSITAIGMNGSTGNALHATLEGANSVATLSNSGSITASSNGLNAKLNGANSIATLSNSGSVTIGSVGLIAELNGDNSIATLSNSGSITATSQPNTVGMRTNLYGANSRATLSNSGSITATSQGMLAILDGVNSRTTLSNSGSITVHGVGYGYGMIADQTGNDSTVTLSNNGSITVTATAPSSFIYGLSANLTGANSVVTLSNTGTIHLSGTTAHQAYVSGINGTNGIAYISTWAMEWRDYSGDAVSQKPFAVDEGATLDFSKARLILTPAAKGFVYGKAYAVKDIYHDYGNGTITGAIASVQGALPFLQATLSGTDVSNQTIALTVDAQRSDGQAVAVNTVATQHGMANRIGNILSASASGGASAGISSGDAADTVTSRGSLQFRPYYGYQSRRGLAAASTDAVGAAIVGTYETEDGHSFGAHAALEHSWMDNRGKTLETRSTAGLLGVHGRYNLTPAAYVRGQISGMISSNSNDFRTIAGNSTSTYTTGGGLYGAVFGGYDLKVDHNNTITPELGISALWSHTPAMDVKYDNSAFNQSYAAENYTAVYGNASLRWTGGFDIGGVMIKPTVMGGVRQAFTDGKIKSSLTYAGSRFESSITDDRTIGIAQVGASLPVAANADLGLNYYGEYGKDTTNHMGYLNLKVKF